MTNELFDMISAEDIQENRFTIDTDAKAEWAMKKVAERNEERDRLIRTCDEMIDYYIECKKQETFKADRDTANLMWHLQNYFRSVDTKSTKTQSTYKLPSGKLKLKFSSRKISVADDASLISRYPDYVEQVQKLKWGDLKKNLAIDDDGNVIDTTTGELVEGCTVEVTPEKFCVECD